MRVGRRVRLLPGPTVATYAGAAVVSRRDGDPPELMAVVRLDDGDCGYLHPLHGGTTTFVTLLLVHPDNIGPE